MDTADPLTWQGANPLTNVTKRQSTQILAVYRFHTQAHTYRTTIADCNVCCDFDAGKISERKVEKNTLNVTEFGVSFVWV
jgi:hypothetical protein